MVQTKQFSFGYIIEIEPGPASSVVERSLRKNSSSEGTAVRSPPQEAFSIANLFRKKD